MHFLVINYLRFSLLNLTSGSPNGLLIDLAIIIQYCYSFCKRLIEHARSSSQVFDILCHVSSALLAHMASIHWKAIVDRLGGWVSNRSQCK